MGQHTKQDLIQMQALPLSIKIRMTEQRIRDWVREYGEDGVYISFSDGKDSTVLLDLVRNRCGYTNIEAVFCDTGLEYPEIRTFVRKFDNVTWLKPKLTFKQVIEKYGYPFIGKEVSERVYYAQRYWRWYISGKDGNPPKPYGIVEMAGVPRRTKAREDIIASGVIPDEVVEAFAKSNDKGNYKIKQLYGINTNKDGSPTMFNYSKYKWMVNSPYMFSSSCCDVMKKAPVHAYEKATGRKGMTGQMAAESRLRMMNWMQFGCNGFQMKHPISNPMAFWTDQDVLHYIKENNIPICSVYGDIVPDMPDECDGQISIEDLGLIPDNRKLKTTGCYRTGCMFCGYGCHLEKPNEEGRFERMKRTHPKQYDYIMRPKEKGGLNYKEVIDWLNENGDLHIRY